MTEIRCRRTDVRRQRSEDRCQRTDHRELNAEFGKKELFKFGFGNVEFGMASHNLDR